VGIKKMLIGAIYTLLNGQGQLGSEIEILMKMFHENGTVDDAQYDRLMNEIKAGAVKTQTEKQSPQVESEKTNDIKLKIDEGSRNGEEPNLFQVRGKWAF